MIFLNNFIPIRIYYSASLDLYRLQTCRADIDTIEFDEEFIANKLSSYQLQTTLYGLNPRLFPPVPLGTSMFSIYQNDQPPYETKKMEWIAFPIMTTVATEKGDFSVFCFVTSPGSLGSPVFIRNEEKNVKITHDRAMIENYFLKTPYDQKALDRDNFVLWFFEKPYLYWRGTTESLCVPSQNPNHFPTLIDCQRKTYAQLKNHKSYTGNSGKPLSWMKSRTFPWSPEKKRGWVFFWTSLILLFLIMLIIVFKYVKKRE